MSTHDAPETDSATDRGEPRSGADRSRAVESAGAATKQRSRWFFRGRYEAPRVATRDTEVENVAEGEATDSSLARDAIYRRLLAFADVAAAAFAFVITVTVMGSDNLGLLAVAAIAMVVLVCKLAGLYDRDEHLLHKRTLDEAPALFYVATLYTLLVFLAGDAIVDGTFGRDQAAVLWVMLFLSMLVGRTAARWTASALVKEERCVIIGSAPAGEWLSCKLERCEGAKTSVVGRVPLNREDASVNGLPMLGSCDSLETLLAENRVDRALIAPGEGDSDLRLLHVIRVLKRLGVRVSVLPRLFEAVGSAYEFDEVEGATLLGVKRHGLSRSSWLIKRSFDIVASAAILLVLAPMMAMIAIAIRLDSRGPVFFRQRRVGRADSVFEIYKFRTMIEDADAQKATLVDRNEAGGGLFKIEDDPRITRVGRFLRRTSLDELPQLLNVLRGDMSLVGPRPLVVDEDRLIEGHHRHRLLVPPGVTGLWQIFGSARIPLNEMVKIDYLYGANWSLWLDLKILLRTVPVVIGQRGL
jgi:exopolysaccharide biosynthesis polyprenyl glycosylphosphotransferase